MKVMTNADTLSTLENLPLEDYLRSYRWAEVWRAVRELRFDPAVPCHRGLAIKAMLLAGWWQEMDEARQILARHTPNGLDALTHFALSYTALCLGAMQRYAQLQRVAPVKRPVWMQHWLDIEQLGRSAQTAQQLKKLRTTLAKSPAVTPPDYLFVALLQSATHPLANSAALAKWLQSLPDTMRRTSVLMACLDTFVGHPCDAREIPLADMPAQLLYWHAKQLKKEGKVLNALPALDALARSLFIDLVGILSWLTLSISCPQGYAAHGDRVQFAINLVPNSLAIQGTVAGYALISVWIRGDYEVAHAIVKRYHPYLKLPKTSLVSNTQIFFAYAGKLCLHWQANPSLYQRHTGASNSAPSQALVAVGESHSMTLANLYFDWLSHPVKGLTAFVMGAKMHHLADKNQPHYQGECVRLHLEALKHKPVHLLMTIGEIDCRPDEGLWPLHRQRGLALDELIERTVDGYIDFLQRNLHGHQLVTITIQGIPAPGYAFEDDKDPGDIPGFVAMIRAVNDCLRAKALAAGYSFLDVYAATVRDDGRGNGRWHLDGYHLSPAFYSQAQDSLISPN